MRRAGCIALGVALVGCGPPLRALVANHHDREVVCAAVDGVSPEALATSLDESADLQVHVSTVDAPPVREANARSAAPVSLLQVDAQSNVLPLDDLTLSAAMGAVDGGASALPVRWDVLAAWTGETLPPPRASYTYLTGGNLLRLAAAALSAGFSLLVSDFRPDVIRSDAPVAAYRAAAPRAAQILDLMTSSGCNALAPGAGAGVRCRWFFLYTSSTPSPLALSLTTRYVAHRVSGARGEPARCVLPRRVTMVVGTPDGWDPRFAAGPQRVRALATPTPLASASAWERITEALSPVFGADRRPRSPE